MAISAVQDGKGSKIVAAPQSRRFERLFFSITSLLMLVVVYEGFSPTYYRAGLFHAPLPSFIIHVHAVAFSCWMLLLVIQTTLVSAGRVAIHRRLGIAGFLLGCSMLILGVWSATDSMARGVAPPGVNPKSFYIVSMSEMLIFGTLLFLAFLYRRDSRAHKRLIYIATTTLLGAAFARIPLPGSLANGIISSLYSYSFLLILAMFDLWSMRKVHRVTIWASAFLIVLEMVRYSIAETFIWQAFATWVLNIVR
jgi:hypothetical protein